MKKLIILASLSLIIFSCKKYPDGPSLTLSSKKSRVAGTWKISKVLEDGTDVTSNYTSYAMKDFVLTTAKDGKYTLSFSSFGIPYSEDGNWSFSDDKTKLIFDPTSNSSANEEDEIRELRQNEMTLRDVVNNKNVDFYLTQ